MSDYAKTADLYDGVSSHAQKYPKVENCLPAAHFEGHFVFFLLFRLMPGIWFKPMQQFCVCVFPLPDSLPLLHCLNVVYQKLMLPLVCMSQQNPTEE
jgi:hypothetical protein